MSLRIVRVLLRKEYLQIFRDKVMLRQMILMPFVQLLLLSSAATFEVKTAHLYLVDGDHSYEGLKADWEGWAGLIAPGGIVALHDSRPTPTRPIHDAGSVRYTAGVVRADSRFHVVDQVDSLTVLERLGT